MTVLPQLDHEWIDEKRAPLYVLTFPEQPSSEELHAFFDVLEAWYQKLRGPVSFVVRVDNVISADSRMRKIVTDRDAGLAEYQDKYLKGVALVANSAFSRGLVTAVSWVHRFHAQQRVFGRLEEALIWAQECLQAND
jgi:hypothetical protein